MALNIFSFSPFYWDYNAFEQFSNEFHLSFLSISKKGRLWRTGFFFFFFITSKASVTHNWNFYLILWIFTENSLRSMEIEGNKPISNYSYSPWGSCPSQLSPSLLWTHWDRAEFQCKCRFGWVMGTISMHKVGAIYSSFSWVIGSWRKYYGERIWGGHEKPKSTLPLLCPSKHTRLGKQGEWFYSFRVVIIKSMSLLLHSSFL